MLDTKVKVINKKRSLFPKKNTTAEAESRLWGWVGERVNGIPGLRLDGIGFL